MEWRRKRSTLEPERAGARGTSPTASLHQGKCPSSTKRRPLTQRNRRLLKIFFNRRRLGIWGDKVPLFCERDSLCRLPASLGGKLLEATLTLLSHFRTFSITRLLFWLWHNTCFLPDRFSNSLNANRRTLKGGAYNIRRLSIGGIWNL